MVIFLLRYK